MVVTVETLRGELEEAFRNRAHLYRILLEELEAELGPEQAEAVLARAVERRGREVAAGLFAGMPADPQAIGARFLAASSDGGRLYPHDAECRHGTMAIRVHRCPLKEAWCEAGLKPGRIATLCRIAGAFDRGLFEAAGLTFTNETWSEARGGGCCWIRLSWRDHRGSAGALST
jgi:L-2-amino-thiazoline-4-carboxylic acid hydrolase